MVTPAGGGWMPQRLAAVEVAYYRDVLVAHADDLILQVCAVCQVTRCPDWRNAYDRLAAAGELMTPPQRWHGMADVDRKPRS